MVDRIIPGTNHPDEFCAAFELPERPGTILSGFAGYLEKVHLVRFVGALPVLNEDQIAQLKIDYDNSGLWK